MGDFITRLDDDQLTKHDRRAIRSLLFTIRAAEQIATQVERNVPGEWRAVVVRADELEQG